MAYYKTFERTTTERLDYKFDLAAVTNGRDDAEIDRLAPGEKIASYTLTSSDTDLVISNDSLDDDGTSVVFFASGGDLTDSEYFVDLHAVSDSTPAREYDCSMRFVPVARHKDK